MSGMNQATHDYIVFKLSEALRLLEQAQRDTPVKKGYKNFDLAVGIVHGCQKRFGDTWEATRDANRAMPDLVSARTKLMQVHAGTAAPSVAAAIKHVDEIIRALTHHIDMPSGIVISDRQGPEGKVKVGAWEAKNGMVTVVHLGNVHADITQLGGYEDNPAALAYLMLSESKGTHVKPRKAAVKRKRTKAKRQ